MRLSPFLQTDACRRKCRELYLHTRAVTVYPFAQVNFDHQVIVGSQCLAEGILSNFETPIQITSQRRPKVERNRERQIVMLKSPHINLWVLVYPVLYLPNDKSLELSPG